MKLRGTWHGANGVPIGVTFRSTRQRTSLTDEWKLLEQGPESQSASGVCSGGVSAVMGSSDLDALTLVSDEAGGNQLSCSLPFGASPTHGGSGVPQRAEVASQCKASQRVPGSGSVRSTLWR